MTTALAPIPSSGLTIPANLPRAYRAGANRLNLWLDGREANQENILAFFIGLQDETILSNCGEPYKARHFRTPICVVRFA